MPPIGEKLLVVILGLVLFPVFISGLDGNMASILSYLSMSQSWEGLFDDRLHVQKVLGRLKCEKETYKYNLIKLNIQPVNMNVS